MRHPGEILKPNVLCIVPPYTFGLPPAGAAALLGYLKASGCDDFDFIDLRLWSPPVFAPTYSSAGVFGQSFVMDVPDLPLVMRLLEAHDQGRSVSWTPDEKLERYCADRALDADVLCRYLERMDRFLGDAAAQLKDVAFIGFSVWSTNLLTTLMAASHLKRRARPPFIVAGGPQVTESVSSARLALRSGLFDAAAQGEGEETLLEVYREFRRDRQVSRAVPGTIQRDEGSSGFRSTPRSLLKLPNLPLPDFEEMNIAAYQATGQNVRRLPFQLSRGCTDECSFCSEWVFWRHFRSDTPDHVMEQIRQLRARYDVEELFFTDSLLNGHAKRLQAFAERLLFERIPIRWHGFMRAQVDTETAALLARAGLSNAFIGIESLSDETLELMNKRMTEAANLRSLDALLGAGVHVNAGVIPGFPGDTRERFFRTIMLLKQLQKKYPGLLTINREPFIVSPSQPIFAELERYGLAGKKWDDELIGAAERYADIVGDIFCTVEGANQGVERLGQFAIATMASSDRPLFSAQHHVPIATGERVDFLPLVRGWSLARVHDAAGYYGAIVSRDERGLFVFAARSSTPSSTAGLEDELFHSLLREVERAHWVAPRPAGAPLRGGGYGARLDGAARMRLSPFVVARPIGQGGSERILLAEIRQARWMVLPAAFAPVVRALDAGGAGLDDLRALVPGVKPGRIESVLSRLRNLGFLAVYSELDRPVEAAHPTRPRLEVLQ